MYRDSCVTYYQKSKEKIQKRPHERYYNKKKRKTENDNMVVNNTRISQKLENQG